MRNGLMLVLLLTFLTAHTTQWPLTSSQDSARSAEFYGQLPLSFEINQGQSDKTVKFLSRGQGYTLFLTSTEAVLALRKARAKPAGREGVGYASHTLTPASGTSEASEKVRDAYPTAAADAVGRWSNPHRPEGGPPTANTDDPCRRDAFCNLANVHLSHARHGNAATDAPASPDVAPERGGMHTHAERGNDKKATIRQSGAPALPLMRKSAIRVIGCAEERSASFEEIHSFDAPPIVGTSYGPFPSHGDFWYITPGRYRLMQCQPLDNI